MDTESKKRKYVKPAIEVYELQQTVQLLQMSGRDPYDPTDGNPFDG